MKIVKLTAKRFRGIQDSVTFNFQDFNVIVGRNDKGKSTILKALNLFLNDIEAVPEISNAYQDNKIVEIELSFEIDINTRLELDGQSISFLEAGIYDENELITIKKEWDTGKPRIKPEIYIKRKKTEPDLLTEKTQALIKLCAAKNINNEHDESNDFSMISKLQPYYNNSDLDYEYTQIPSSGKTRVKLIYDALKRYFPRFEYFRADNPLDESDVSIQKYFKELTKQILIQNDIDSLEETIENKLSSTLATISGKINEVLPEDQQVEAQIKFNWSNLINVSFRSKRQSVDIPLSFRGDGFRRLTMMAYFEHLAEESRDHHQNIVFGFEEPETFLHPKAQEELFERLKLLAENGYQIILTTHSSVMVASSECSDLSHVTSDQNTLSINQDIQDFKAIIEDLGITQENHFYYSLDQAKVMILVEGPDDVNAFDYLSQVYHDNNLIESTFSNLGMVIIPIGGCQSVKHWHSLEVLQNLGKPFYIIQDSDRLSRDSTSKNQEKLLELELNEGDDFWILKKREIENYINPSYFRRVKPEIDLTYDDYSDVKEICKTHAERVFLGGKKVAGKHFRNQNYQEIRQCFQLDGDDEFILIYNNILRKLAT